MRIATRVLAFVALAVASVLLSASGALASGVLPARARPHGWSLDRMTAAMAQFSTSGNSGAYYPPTPFQILYAAPNTGTLVSVDGGYEALNSNNFVASTGTYFFVPLWNADDSPPIVGVWPMTHQEAIPYFFAPSQVGGRDFAITIDGHATPIGPAYLAGPITTAPLQDGGGTHIITLGAFVHPLPAGSHTISISGGVFGSDIPETYSFAFLEQDITYTVTVRPFR